MSPRQNGRRYASIATKTEPKIRMPLSSRPDHQLCRYEHIPAYLQVNPYLRNGYRCNFSRGESVKSIFKWTNETINIWSHLLGFCLFAGMLIYDVCYTIPKFKPPVDEIVIMVYLLISCMVCMGCSAAYHTFCCESEKTCEDYLSWDIAGIIIAFAAVFISGIHYAFSCFTNWRLFYESIVTVLSVAVLVGHFRSTKRTIREEKHMIVVFTLWAFFGFVPSFHWAFLGGGFENPMVRNLLPRVGVMYLVIGVAFFFYLTRYPEKCCPGKVDYFGASHQLWHIFVVIALAWWHELGITYAQLKLIHGCT